MTNTRLKSAPVERPATVELRVLGGFAVIAEGQALPDRVWDGSRKARSLAKLLTLAPGQRLHQAIYQVRRALVPLGIEVALQTQVIALRAQGELTTDLATFEAAAATTSLGESAYATAHASGHAWSAEESIAQVLAYLTD
jgi:DNA-binding SARP family transcriptional activator